MLPCMTNGKQSSSIFINDDKARSTSSRWVATMRPPCLRCRTSSTSTRRPRRTQSSALGCLQSPRKSGQVWISHTTVQQHPAREEVPGLVRDARLHHSHGSHPGATFLAPVADEIVCPEPPDVDLRVWIRLITSFKASNCALRSKLPAPTRRTG